jgi:hypothetical protein
VCWNLNLEVATTCVSLDQQWVATRSGSTREMGHGQATQGEGLVLLPAWLRHCGTASGGHRASLDEEDGAGGKNG